VRIRDKEKSTTTAVSAASQRLRILKGSHPHHHHETDPVDASDTERMGKAKSGSTRGCRGEKEVKGKSFQRSGTKRIGAGERLLNKCPDVLAILRRRKKMLLNKTTATETPPPIKTRSRRGGRQAGQNLQMPDTKWREISKGRGWTIFFNAARPEEYRGGQLLSLQLGERRGRGPLGRKRIISTKKHLGV